jgi:nucleotide-binding universal stress UspA family protein
MWCKTTHGTPFVQKLKINPMKNHEFEQVRKILIPIDFSTVSEQALYYGCHLAASWKASIHLLHVNEAPAMMTSEQAFAFDYSDLDKEMQDRLDHMRQNLKSKFSAEIFIHYKSGFASEEIRDVAESEGCGLIIMGTHGATGLGRMLLGSHTARIIEKADIPVLAIPPDTELKVPAKIAFATNFNDQEIESLFQLTEVVKPFSPQIMIIHVDESGTDPDERMMDWFAGQVKTNILYENISFHMNKGPFVDDSLEEFIVANNIDWISIAKRNRSFFERLKSRSLTKELVYHTHIPLLALHLHDIER